MSLHAHHPIPAASPAAAPDTRVSLTDRARRGGTLPWPHSIILLALVVLAALLRAWHLDHMSIWQDEGLSLYRATQDLATILSGRIPLGALMTQDLQPPLYFVLLASWFKLVGVSTWAAKWLALLTALPAIPLTWALGRRWVGRTVGLVAAGLVALSPAYLWYSQEIRSYSLAITLALAGVYALERGLAPGDDRRRRLAWLAGSLVANGLLVWTHYLGFFVVLFEALWLLAVAVRSHRREVLVVLAVLALVGLPLVPFAVQRLGTGRERHQVFHPLHDWLLTVLGGFAMGRTMPPALVPLGLLLFGALLIAGTGWLWRHHRRALWLLAGYLFVPTLAFYALTFVKPAFRGVQHLLLQSPPFYLLVAAGLVAATRRRPALGAAAAALVVAAMLMADWSFYRDARFAKDDLRGLAEYVDARAVPGDVLAVSDPVLELAFQQLVTGAEVRAVPPMGADGRPVERPPQDFLAPLLIGRHRLWFMSPDDALADWLDRRALKVDEQGFHGPDIPVRLFAYERRPAEPEDLPRRTSANAVLGRLKPLGADALPSPLQPGRGARVRLAWQVYEEGAPDYKVSLRLLDDQDRVVGQSDDTVPSSNWPYGEVTYWPQDLTVSPGAAPGDYRLAVTVYDPATGEAWPADAPLVLGEVEVGRARQPVAPADVAVGQRLAARGGGVTLFGVDRAAAGGLAGERWPVSLWLAGRSGTAPAARARVELVDALGRVRATAEEALAAGDAPLQPGDLRRVPLSVNLPPDAGRYGLRARLLDGDGRTLWLWRGLLPVRAAALGAVDVRSPERHMAEPAMDHRVDALVGDSARLLGYDLPVTQVQAGDPLPITLHWRAEARAPTSYRATVQLVPVAPGSSEPAGPPAAQHDGVPGDGARPTSGWLPGEVVSDAHTLALPANLPPGDYLLIAALYDPEQPNAPRPVVAQGGARRDYVALQPVTVTGPASSTGTAAP